MREGERDWSRGLLRIPSGMPEAATVSASNASTSIEERPLSVEDLEEITAYCEKPVEILSGKLIFMSPASHLHGLVTNNLAYLLTHHVRRHSLGTLLAAETGFRLHHPQDPEGTLTVRGPDVTFLGREKSALPVSLTFSEVVPDLVVEVLSPGDRASLVSEKTAWWLACGVAEAWVVDPPNRRLTRHFADLTSRSYPRDAVVAEVPLLPGLELSLAEVFPEF